MKNFLKKTGLFILGALLAPTYVYAVSVFQQVQGGTATSTIFQQGSIVYQATSSYAGLAPSNGQFLSATTNSIQWVNGAPSYPTVITVPATVTVTTSTVETDLVNVTIPPNTLGTNRALQADLFISDLIRAGAGITITTTFRMYYGNVLQSTFFIKIGSVTSDLSGHLVGTLLANNSVSSQAGNLSLFASGLQNVPSLLSTINQFTTSSPNVDSTQAQPLRITVQQSTSAGGNQVVRMAYAVVDLLSASSAGDVFASTTNIFSGQNFFTTTTTISGPLTIPTGAVNGYILTTNASGVTSWQPAPATGVSTTQPNTWTAPQTFTSSTFMFDAYNIPCAKFATSTGNPVWASICLQDQVTTVSTTPGADLARNAHFTVFSGPSTPDQWATGTLGTNFNIGGPSTGGSATFIQTSTCSSGSLCAENDTINGSASGDAWISALSQSFTYDPTKPYTATFNFAGSDLQPSQGGPGAIACDLFSTDPISNALNSGGGSTTGSLWDVNGNTWIPFTGFNDVGNAINCNLSTTTAFQDVPWQSAPVTGNAGTTTVYFNLLTINGGTTSTPGTFIFNNASYGYPAVTQTTTTGTDQFIFHTPTGHPYHFYDEQAQFHQGVSSTALRTDALQLTSTTVPFGSLLGASDASGTAVWGTPSAFGIRSSPWILTAGTNGYYLQNGKSACVGSASSSCDIFTPGTIAGPWASITDRLALGSIDAQNQNQQLTAIGPNGNGDASMLFTSANTSTLSSVGSDIGESGEGGRMFYFAKQNAFRAGYSLGTDWDVNNIGSGSAAFGIGTKASGVGSFAIGTSSQATADNTFAGGGGIADQHYAFAYGPNARAEAVNAIAMGHETSVTADRGVALGTFSQARGRDCVALGGGLCEGDDSFAVFGHASNTQAIAIGAGAYASGQSSFAFPFSSANGDSSISMLGNQTNGANSFGAGTGALNADHSYSFGTNMDVNGRFSHCISIGAFGAQDANCDTDYTFFVATDPINPASIVFGGATSTAGGDTLFTINNAGSGRTNALSVLGGNVGIGTTTPSTLLSVDAGSNPYAGYFTGTNNDLNSGLLQAENKGSGSALYVGSGRTDLKGGLFTIGPVTEESGNIALDPFSTNYVTIGTSTQAAGSELTVAGNVDATNFTCSGGACPGSTQWNTLGTPPNDFIYYRNPVSIGTSNSFAQLLVQSNTSTITALELQATANQTAPALVMNDLPGFNFGEIKFDGSINFGPTTTASGDNSAAFGSSVTASGAQSVAFGLRNSATAANSAIWGGKDNETTALNSSVTGGHDNRISSLGASSLILNGFENTIDADGCTIIGGGFNTCAGGGGFSDVFGFDNYASGTRAFIIGSNNTINGSDSFAAGDSLTVNGSNSFGFNLSTTTAETIDASNVFDILHANVGINTTTPNKQFTVSGNTRLVGTLAAGSGPNVANGINSVALGENATVNGADTFLFNADPGVSYNVSATDVFDVMGANVGIGTTTPQTALSVVGTSTFSGDMVQASGVAQAGQALCYLSNGAFGHCTSVIGVTGACSCSPN